VFVEDLVRGGDRRGSWLKTETMDCSRAELLWYSWDSTATPLRSWLAGTASSADET
jgi:hypothetical protein